MIMLSHGWRCYPTDENIYDFYSRGIIGVIVHGHVINNYIYIYYIYLGGDFENLNLLTNVIPNFCPFPREHFWSNKILLKFGKMPARRPICFGYMQKTNQIAGKAYRTTLDSKRKFTENLTLIKDKRSKVNKGQNQFGILIMQSIRNKILKKV